MHNTKPRAALLLLALLLAFLPLGQASASFSSLHVFGDGVCTTTATLSPANLYYGEPGKKRYCNGRVWVEVLSQWQGLAYDAAKNKSYFGHDSEELEINVDAFVAPPDVSSALFVIWCNDADFVNFATNLPSTLSVWTTSINASIEIHKTAINTLYAKGARTIVMPNAVNIMATPAFYFSGISLKAFVRDRVIQFNTAFDALLAERTASLTGLTIYRPDTFTFFEQVLANPPAYGLGAYSGNYAIESEALGSPAFPGPGDNYVFWDDMHPTAKFQMHLAAFVQQIISPPKVTSVLVSGGNVQLQVANIPLERAGIVQGSSNLQPSWTQDTTFTVPFVAGASTTSTVSFPVSGPQRFYRVGFPVVWTWP